jgi:hypothetical protein
MDHSDPLWACWDWDAITLPPSALSDTTQSTSVLSWIQKKPHLDSPSPAKLESVFLALGLAIFNSQQNTDVWVDITSLIVLDVQNNQVYQ